MQKSDKLNPHSTNSPITPEPYSGNNSLLRLYLEMSEAERSERFADTARVAERYQIAQRTIQSWIRKGLVRAVPIGSKLKVDLLSLEEYLMSRALQREAAGLK